MTVTLSIKLIGFGISLFILFLFSGLAKHFKKGVKILGIIGSLYGIIYIIWRIGFTIPSQFGPGMIFGIILVFFEILGIIQSLVFKMLFSAEVKNDYVKDACFTELPTVDVIISTYNEPKDVLKRTIVAATKIQYPKTKLNIYVGDDGSREDIKKLCASLDVHHITREDHSHAKAGNINNVLSHACGEFFLVLDADMIPKDTILKEMIYFFEDSSCGFVQAPQVFYNHDVFQYNLKVKNQIPSEQDFFMRTILEKRTRYNAVLHVGSNAVFRRSAIESIGGIPTSSITEDMATGMLLQAKKWKSFFINKALAVGLSVETIQDQIKQRDRWLRGNIQVIKKNNPLTLKGLTLAQRIIYLDGFIYWTHGVQRMIYIIAPFLYLLFRIKLFDAAGFDILLLFIPYFVSNSLYFKQVSHKTRNITWSHIYDTALAPQMAWSFLTEFFFGSTLKFNVTPKGNTTNKDYFNLRLALPHILLLTISILCIALNVAHIFKGTLEGDIFPALSINFFWCIYNSLAIFISIFLYVDRKRLRKTERIPVDLATSGLITSCPFYKKLEQDHKELCKSCGKVIDISDEGAKIIAEKGCKHFNFTKGQEISLSIDTVGKVKARVVRLVEKDTVFEMGIAFTEIDFDTFNNINKYRFDIHNRYMGNNGINTKNDNFLEIIAIILG